MSLADNKITSAEVAAYGVQSQPNKLTGSAQQNKQAFDRLIDEIVRVKFNALIDQLLAVTAARELGVSVPGLEASTVQDAFAAILAAMQHITHQGVAPGSITHTELADGAVTAAKLGTDIRPEHVGIRYGTETPTAATLGEGEIYLKIETE